MHSGALQFQSRALQCNAMVKDGTAFRSFAFHTAQHTHSQVAYICHFRTSSCIQCSCNFHPHIKLQNHTTSGNDSTAICSRKSWLKCAQWNQKSDDWKFFFLQLQCWWECGKFWGHRWILWWWIITTITTTSIIIIIIIIIIIMCVGGNAQVVRSRGWILWGSKHHASPHLTNIPHTQDGLCTIQFFCSSTYLRKMVGWWVGGSHRRRSNSDEGGDQHHCGNTPDKLSWVYIFAAKISNRLNVFLRKQFAILYEL